MKDRSYRREPWSISAGPFLGRLLISAIFILSGVMKIFQFGATVDILKDFGIQFPALATIVAIIFELGGGILVLLGWYTHIGVYLLMIFLLPTTFLFHGFWNHEGHERMVQMSNFLKNITIYGGLLLLWSYGPGKWSLDARFRRRRTD